MEKTVPPIRVATPNCEQRKLGPVIVRKEGVAYPNHIEEHCDDRAS
jgi:hypothetical protein